MFAGISTKAGEKELVARRVDRSFHFQLRSSHRSASHSPGRVPTSGRVCRQADAVVFGICRTAANQAASCSRCKASPSPCANYLTYDLGLDGALRRRGGGVIGMLGAPVQEATRQPPRKPRGCGPRQRLALGPFAHQEYLAANRRSWKNCPADGCHVATSAGLAFKHPGA
jgi:hypothetical protein